MIFYRARMIFFIGIFIPLIIYAILSPVSVPVQTILVALSWIFVALFAVVHIFIKRPWLFRKKF